MLRARCGRVRLNTPSMLYAETEREEQWCGVWARASLGRQDRHASCYLSDTPVATYQKVSRDTGLSLGTTGLCPTLAPRVLLSASRGEPVGGEEAHTEHGAPRGRARWQARS
jgi:hypothetical protein